MLVRVVGLLVLCAWTISADEVVVRESNGDVPAHTDAALDEVVPEDTPAPAPAAASAECTTGSSLGDNDLGSQHAFQSL